jgi:hypothetical protein
MKTVGKRKEYMLELKSKDGNVNYALSRQQTKKSTNAKI